MGKRNKFVIHNQINPTDKDIVFLVIHLPNFIGYKQFPAFLLSLRLISYQLLLFQVAPKHTYALITQEKNPYVGLKIRLPQ